jgi:hypothetical protein
MNSKMDYFKNVKIGDYFFVMEDGTDNDYKKVSETEAQLAENGIATEFSPEYAVCVYPPSVDFTEFNTYYDAQGREHAEF